MKLLWSNIQIESHLRNIHAPNGAKFSLLLLTYLREENGHGRTNFHQIVCKFMLVISTSNHYVCGVSESLLLLQNPSQVQVLCNSWEYINKMSNHTDSLPMVQLFLGKVEPSTFHSSPWCRKFQPLWMRRYTYQRMREVCVPVQSHFQPQACQLPVQLLLYWFCIKSHTSKQKPNSDMDDEITAHVLQTFQENLYNTQNISYASELASSWKGLAHNRLERFLLQEFEIMSAFQKNYNSIITKDSIFKAYWMLGFIQNQDQNSWIQGTKIVKVSRDRKVAFWPILPLFPLWLAHINKDKI